MQTLTDDRLKQAQAVVAKVSLPAQPDIVIEINREMSGAHPDFKKIGALVSRDPSLSAKVLNVINSPFFGMTRKVDSIVQALTLMGLQNFFRVILTTALKEAITGGNKKDSFLWQHSLHTALAAEQIAKSLGSTLRADGVTTDQAYLAGLFHDCAISALARRSPNYAKYNQYFLSHKVNVAAAEDKTAGSDHCVIGHLMAKSWSLTDSVCKAILYHHEQDTTTEKDLPHKLIAVLELADFLAYTFAYNTGLVDTLIKDEWEVNQWCYVHHSAIDTLVLHAEDVADYQHDIHERLTQCQSG